MRIQNPERHLAMLLVGMLYAANFSVMKTVTPQYVMPFGFLVLRVGISALIFIAIGLLIGEKVDWKNDFGRILLCAVFGVGINMLCFFKGLSMTTAINGSIIMTLTPIMVFVTSIFLLKDKLSSAKIVGLLVGLAGAFMIIYKQDPQISEGNWFGDLLIFINALSYGTYLVLVKPLLVKYRPITIAMWAFLFGFIFILPFGYHEMTAISWDQIPSQIFVNMAYVIIGVTVVVYFVNIWAMKKVSPATVGAYIYVQPVFATLIASHFYNETLTIKHLIAAALVFVGVGLVIIKK